MPEAPDVEVYRRYVEATSLHQRIESIDIGDTRLLEETTESQLRSAASATELEEAVRTGKYLFVRLSAGGHLLLHFGMTGTVAYYKHGRDTPDYTQLVVSFDNGYRLAYVNKRILGRVGYVEDADEYLAAHDIGPDVIRLGEAEFSEIIGRGRGAVKSTLMNQKMMSGLGNVYSDEILYQSGVHPKSIGRALPRSVVHRIHDAVHHVFDVATAAKANPPDMPADFLVRHREGGSRFDGCSGGVVKEQVSGRSCYYCPSRQKYYE